MAKATTLTPTERSSPYYLRSSKTPEPSSPGSEGIVPYEPYPDDRYVSNDLHVELYPEDLEHIEDYNAGGDHPVHLGDCIKDERYRVIHKLGSGGFANVWFCRDMHSQETTKYVALKILMADASTDDCPELLITRKLEELLSGSEKEEGARYICQTLDQFEVQGPNGRHFCFVTPVLGPRVSSHISYRFKDPDKVLRSVCFKVTQAMDYLHNKGICHGDFRPHNILFRTKNLDGLSEEQILAIFGEPLKNLVLTQHGEMPTIATAPQYLIFPVTTSIDPTYLTPEPSIIDFGESFFISNPPPDLGIPRPYNSPELILEKTIGYNTDIWALGCTIFEIRTGRKIFNPFTMGDEPDEYLIDMVDVLGPLPEPWWSDTWKGRRVWFRDEVDEGRRAIYVNPPFSERIEESSQEKSEEKEESSGVHAAFPVNPRSLREKLAPGVYYVGEESDVHREIGEEEVESLEHLLERILKLDPKKRLTAKEVLGHEWFKM